MPEIIRPTGTRELPVSTIPIAEQETLIHNFNRSIDEINARVDYENRNLTSPMKEELFRAEVVMLVSALDYYLYEVLKTGIIQIYLNDRECTERFTNLRVPMRYVTSALENPESNEWLSEAIVEIFGTTSFQSVKQIKFVLSVISSSTGNQLFRSVADNLPITKSQLEISITSLCQRRHQIAHNCDIPPNSDVKDSITIEYLQENIQLLRDFVNLLHDRIVIR